MQEAPGARIVKSGRRTYFIDTKTTKDGKGYISITESTLIDANKNLHQRSKILVFAESLKEFSKEISAAVKSI